MKIKLLEPHGNLKAGAEWNCPWASKARQMIEEGKALALEAADLHLNPDGAAVEAEADREPIPVSRPKPPAAKKPTSAKGKKPPKPPAAKKPTPAPAVSDEPATNPE